MDLENKEYVSKADMVAEITKLKEHFVNKRDDFERGYHYGLNLLQERLTTIESIQITQK